MADHGHELLLEAFDLFSLADIVCDTIDNSHLGSAVWG
jgi:hypothetical protein